MARGLGRWWLGGLGNGDGWGVWDEEMNECGDVRETKVTEKVKQSKRVVVGQREQELSDGEDSGEGERWNWAAAGGGEIGKHEVWGI